MPAGAAVVDPSQSVDVASLPRGRRVALEVGGRDAARVSEVGHLLVGAGDARVGVIGAGDLKRPEAAAIVANDGAVAPRGLDLMERSPEGLRRRGVAGGRYAASITGA